MDAHVAALERIEQEAWRSLMDAAPPNFAKSVGLECAPIGGALFVMSRVPAFQFNWLAGAGLKADDTEAVGEAVARFRGGPKEIHHPDSPWAACAVDRRERRGKRVSSSTRSLGRSSGERRRRRRGSSSTGK